MIRLMEPTLAASTKTGIGSRFLAFQHKQQLTRSRSAELEHYPIVIVTHEFFKGVRGEKARLHRRNGMAFPRVVTFVDEKVEQVKVYDVRFSDIAKVREHIDATDDGLARVYLRSRAPQTPTYQYRLLLTGKPRSVKL